MRSIAVLAAAAAAAEPAPPPALSACLSLHRPWISISPPPTENRTMPVKRINPIEQHIEKILVGLAGASLLGVVGYQFLGGGGMVNVAGTAVPVPSAYGRVRDEALRLQAEIRSANPPLPQVPAEGGLLADFERQFSGPAVPATIAALPAIPTEGSPSMASNRRLQRTSTLPRMYAMPAEVLSRIVVSSRSSCSLRCWV